MDGETRAKLQPKFAPLDLNNPDGVDYGQVCVDMCIYFEERRAFWRDFHYGPDHTGDDWHAERAAMWDVLRRVQPVGYKIVKDDAA
jgi:hypothetical protein